MILDKKKMNQYDVSLLNQQQDRSILRERFLRVLEYMENKPIEIETFQGTTVTGNFRSIDYDITNVHINNLMTPIGCVPEALIRVSDVVTIKFEISN
jgi:gem associated protein 7